jgi:hypothetical protein
MDTINSLPGKQGSFIIEKGVKILFEPHFEVDSISSMVYLNFGKKNVTMKINCV